MSSVSTLSSRESLSTPLPAQSPSVGGAGTPSASRPIQRTTSARMALEEYRANDENHGLAGKALEAFYGQTLKQVPPGGKMELTVQGQVRAEYAGELKTKVEVERDVNGEYQLTLRGGLGGGLGAASADKAKGSAMLGAQGAVTLRFGSAGEAADRLAALAQTEVQAFTGLAGWAAKKVGLLDSDSLERAAEVRKNVKSFEVGLYAELKGELDAGFARLGAGVLDETHFRVEVQEGKLVYESSVQFQLQGELQQKLKEVVGLGAGVESRVILRAEVALTREELTRLQEGKLQPRELMKPERIQKSVTQEVKGDGAVGVGAESGKDGVSVKLGGSLSAKRELPWEKLGELSSALSLAGDWEVSVMRKRNNEFSVNTGAVELKAEATIETPVFTGTLSLGEVKSSVLQAQARAQSDEQLLQARRALGR
ncbi:hypothetical protein [Archangium sp.]|uniref:hypothetical protein n=1 Tax=Archangium sp. TaxID=1872627 RepID=UPI00286C47EB|nr:hypothetical protein [Archangium sp.]